MIVVLDNIRSALNVGSIIRTCDALGIREIYFCGITPTTENNKVTKTSLGAEKGITEKYRKSTLEAVKELKNTGYQIISLETGGDTVENVETAERVALVVGNEVSGVSEEIINISDAVVSIPMKGEKESLNVAVAFGIAAYEITKRCA